MYNFKAHKTLTQLNVLNCENQPEMNSFGICFFPEVVTRYNVKSSILRITQLVISFERLSRTCFFIGDGICACVGVDAPDWWPFRGFGVRSSGACVGGRFGLLSVNSVSLKLFNDCSSHIAGGTLASLYLGQ